MQEVTCFKVMLDVGICFVLFSSLLVMTTSGYCITVNGGLVLQISFTELKILSQIPFLSGLEQFDIWSY